MNDQPNGGPKPVSADEIQVIESEAEVAPENSGLVVTSESHVKGLQFLADNIEKIVAAHTKIRTTILKLAMPGDYTLWGKSAELGFAGANRIGSTLGVSFGNWLAEKLTGHDENGDWFRWEFTCDASFNQRTVRVYGRAGSRDKFFGFENGQWKELKNVNEGNIKQAAMRAAKKEGVKDLFGLHHMDPDFLKAHGISLDSAGGYKHQDKESKAADMQTVSVQIDSITFKKTDKWTKFTIKDVEGVSYGTFSQSIADEAKKAAEAKTAAKIDFTVDQKYGPTIVSLNGVTGGDR